MASAVCLPRFPSKTKGYFNHGNTTKKFTLLHLKAALKGYGHCTKSRSASTRKRLEHRNVVCKGLSRGDSWHQVNLPIHDPGNWGLVMFHVPGPGVVHQGCGICGLQLLELPAGQFAICMHIYTCVS